MEKWRWVGETGEAQDGHIRGASGGPPGAPWALPLQALCWPTPETVCMVSQQTCLQRLLCGCEDWGLCSLPWTCGIIIKKTTSVAVIYVHELVGPHSSSTR